MFLEREWRKIGPAAFSAQKISFLLRNSSANLTKSWMENLIFCAAFYIKKVFIVKN